MSTRRVYAAIAFCSFVAAVVDRLPAGDWPQILGPHRSGHADDERLADAWPEGGPAMLWQREVGSGFAGPAVAGRTLVMFHRVGDREIVEAVDSQSGQPIWKSGFAVNYSPTFTDDNGPRCVPVIQGGRVYVYGVTGGLRCLDLATGKAVWSRETHKDFAAPEGYFGAGSTPIIEGDSLLVNVGGPRQSAGVVAFDLASGKTLWQAVADTASYSSPVATTVDGVRHVVFITRLKTVSIDPQTGGARWEYAFGQRGPTVNAASPVVIDGHLLTTAHYGVGAVWSKIGRNSAEEIWAGDDVLSSHYATPVAIDGRLYGLHGQERVTPGELRCIDPRTQRVHWRRSNYGYGSLIAADGKLLVLTTGGDVVLVKPSPTRYEELARATLFDTTARALPALSAGRLYARDHQTLKCIDLRQSSAAP